MMKNVVVLLLVAVMIFTLAGCSDDLQSVLERIRDGETESPQSQAPADSGSAQPAETDAPQPSAGGNTPQPSTGTEAPASAPQPVPEPVLEPSTIITIEDIILSGMNSVERIKFVDEAGAAVDMPSDWNDWFVNASVVGSIMLSGTVNMRLSGSSYVYTPSDGYVLSMPFVVGGLEYMIGVRIGAQFAVRKESGGYALVPEETMLLSPAPPPPAPAVELLNAECVLRAVTPGGMALDPIDGSIGFIVNGVTQSSGTIVAATDAHFTFSLTFTLDEPVSAMTWLCLIGSEGGYLDFSQYLSFDSGPQTLDAVINAGAPADKAYEVELYFDEDLVFSDYLELQ